MRKTSAGGGDDADASSQSGAACLAEQTEKQHKAAD